MIVLKSKWFDFNKPAGDSFYTANEKEKGREADQFWLHGINRFEKGKSA
jgi:hypothetical protein